MTNLENAEEELWQAERLVSSLRREHKRGRATVFELERALVALDRAIHNYDVALIKELGVWDSLDPIK